MSCVNKPFDVYSFSFYSFFLRECKVRVLPVLSGYYRLVVKSFNLNLSLFENFLLKSPFWVRRDLVTLRKSVD